MYPDCKPLGAEEEGGGDPASTSGVEGGWVIYGGVSGQGAPLVFPQLLPLSPVLLARNSNTNLLDLQEDDEQKALISVLEDGVALCHVPK